MSKISDKFHYGEFVVTTKCEKGKVVSNKLSRGTYLVVVDYEVREFLEEGLTIYEDKTNEI